MDVSIFFTVEAWISLVTLIFLEIVLGIDNLVFITLTCNRLPSEKESLGRKLGLAGALVSRCAFLCFASWLVHMSDPLFMIPVAGGHPVSIRDLIMIFGGIYLIYKGVSEIRDVLSLADEKAQVSHAEIGEKTQKPREIGLVRAVATIMVMDVVFSIDSVITAVGLANYLIVMILAVMIAVFLMMAFIDPISNFINGHVEMKTLALAFITIIGVLLVLDGLGINSGIEVFDMHAEKLVVYIAMIFSFVLTLIQMRRKANYEKWQHEQVEKED